MTNLLQSLIVCALVGGAFAYIAWNVYRWWTRPVSGCGSACGGCASGGTKDSEKTLVSLDLTPHVVGRRESK